MPDITPEELRLLGGFGTSIVGRALLRSADTIERQGARIAELEAIIKKHDLCHDLHGKVGHAEFEEGCRRESIKEHGSCLWADRISELEQQVAALREDAARWEYMRTSGVVLVIHDVPYRGRELDAPIDAARNKEA